MLAVVGYICVFGTGFLASFLFMSFVESNYFPSKWQKLWKRSIYYLIHRASQIYLRFFWLQHDVLFNDSSCSNWWPCNKDNQSYTAKAWYLGIFYQIFTLLLISNNYSQWLRLEIQRCTSEAVFVVTENNNLSKELFYIQAACALIFI